MNLRREFCGWPVRRAVHRRALSLVGAAIVLVGCATSAFHMRPSTNPVSIGAPAEGRAQVVFFVSGRVRDTVTLVDHRGTYYGQLRENSVVVRDVAPGRYRFYGLWRGHGEAVEIPMLAAGQTAYVGGSDTLMGGFDFRSMQGCDEVARTGRTALPQLTFVEPDPAVTVETIFGEIGNVPRYTAEGDRHLESAPESRRVLHTITAEELVSAPSCP